MRRNPLFCLVFILAGLAGACTDLDDPPVWVEFSYQVRCAGCMPMAQNNEPHRIAALDGDDGLEVICTADGDKISVGVGYDDDDRAKDWSFRLDSVDVTEAGPGSACLLSVREGSSEYVGSCTDEEPTAEFPCQVKLTHEDSVVSGTIFCDDIPLSGDPTATRNVTKISSNTMPFDFEVQNCEGL